ncbi:hypothetical protein QUF94_04045 [Peribacillus sp. NJ4]|nr:hypothetical protein [Peribacillus sp. NJ4]
MTRFSRRSLVPSVPINWNVLKKTVGNPLSSTLSKNKTRLSLMIFTVILTKLKKFATLLPNNWLAESLQALALMWLGRQSAERERISEINWNL